MSKQNPYFDKNGARIVRKSFCLYFDILGFSNNIKEIFNSEKRDYSYFDKYIKILGEELDFIKELSDLGNKYGDTLSFKVFTDNFVIGFPWNDDGESELGDLISIISHIQYTFLINDILIRGAVALSDLHMDENIIIGPALIEAYELESKTALYPRIITSDDIVKVIDKYIGYYLHKDQSPQNQYFLYDKDNKVFINYLMIGNHWIYNEGTFVDFLKKHKAAIIRNANKSKMNYNILQKYMWLAEYHNYFTTYNIDSIDIENEDLLIDLSIISNGFRRIVK